MYLARRFLTIDSYNVDVIHCATFYRNQLGFGFVGMVEILTTPSG